MNWTIIFLVFLVLVFLDKGLTILNIQQTWKNLPDAVKNDQFKVEKNPIAKYLFNNFGLWGGTLIMIGISLITIFLFIFILSMFVNTRIAIYIAIILYGLVIANNFYFLLRYSGVI